MVPAFSQLRFLFTAQPNSLEKVRERTLEFRHIEAPQALASFTRCGPNSLWLTGCRIYMDPQKRS